MHIFANQTSSISANPPGPEPAAAAAPTSLSQAYYPEPTPSAAVLTVASAQSLQWPGFADFECPRDERGFGALVGGCKGTRPARCSRRCGNGFSN